jgi:hypothetical protein
MTKNNCVLTNFKNFTDNINNDIINIITENDQLHNTINELNNKIDNYKNELKLIQDDYDNLKKVSYITSLNKQLHDKNNYIIILESQLNKYKNSKIIDDIDIPSIKNKKKHKDNIIQDTTPDNIIQDTTPDNIIQDTTPDNIIQDTTPDNIIQETIPDNIIQETIPDNIIKKKKKHKSKTQVVESDIILENSTEIEQKVNTPIETHDNINNEIKKKKHKKVSNDDFNPEHFEDINGFELLLYKKTYYLRDLETNELYDIINNKQNNIVGLVNSKGKINFV